MRRLYIKIKHGNTQRILPEQIPDHEDLPVICLCIEGEPLATTQYLLTKVDGLLCRYPISSTGDLHKVQKGFDQFARETTTPELSWFEKPEDSKDSQLPEIPKYSQYFDDDERTGLLTSAREQLDRNDTIFKFLMELYELKNKAEPKEEIEELIKDPQFEEIHDELPVYLACFWELHERAFWEDEHSILILGSSAKELREYVDMFHTARNIFLDCDAYHEETILKTLDRIKRDGELLKLASLSLLKSCPDETREKKVNNILRIEYSYYPPLLIVKNARSRVQKAWQKKREQLRQKIMTDPRLSSDTQKEAAELWFCSDGVMKRYPEYYLGDKETLPHDYCKSPTYQATQNSFGGRGPSWTSWEEFSPSEYEKYLASLEKADSHVYLDIVVLYAKNGLIGDGQPSVAIVYPEGYCAVYTAFDAAGKLDAICTENINQFLNRNHGPECKIVQILMWRKITLDAAFLNILMDFSEIEIQNFFTFMSHLLDKENTLDVIELITAYPAQTKSLFATYNLVDFRYEPQINNILDKLKKIGISIKNNLPLLETLLRRFHYKIESEFLSLLEKLDTVHAQFVIDLITSDPTNKHFSCLDKSNTPHKTALLISAVAEYREGATSETTTTQTGFFARHLRKPQFYHPEKIVAALESFYKSNNPSDLKNIEKEKPDSTLEKILGDRGLLKDGRLDVEHIVNACCGPRYATSQRRLR